MSFRIAVLILALYYLRPQDWVPGMEGWNLMKPVALVGLIALLARPKGLDFKGMLKTPVDWAMLFYAVYIVLTAPAPFDTFKAFLPLGVFYLLTAQGIESDRQLLIYLKWWTGVLLALAGLAVIGLYGIDLLGAQERFVSMGERLAIGTWMHDNPNALGHSVIAAIPMAYVLWFQKNPAANRIKAILLILLAGYCVYLTKSRGAFVVGAGAIVLMLSFGKPKLVQVLVVATALIMGSSILAMLPRMSGDLRSDEGVQGRMLAWAEARNATKASNTGEGYQQFQAYINWRVGRYTLVLPKATHGSYIKIGADLGYFGLFLYLLVIWVSLRIMMLKIPPDDEHVSRLIQGRSCLFLLLATSAVSGWMIDRAYHMEYFLLAGACSAYYRLLAARRNAGETAPEEEPATESGSADAGPISNPLPAPAIGFGSDLRPQITLASRAVASVKLKWRRLTVFDIGVAISMTWVVIYTWDRILDSFLY